MASCISEVNNGKTRDLNVFCFFFKDKDDKKFQICNTLGY